MTYRYRRRYTYSSSSSWLLLTVLLLIVGGYFGYKFFPYFSFNNDYLFFTIIILIATIVLGGILIIYLIWKQQRQRLKALSLSNIDHMTGIEFEQYVGELLKFQGYKIEFTPASNDYGVDIVARRNGSRYAVQIKRYSHMVNNSALQEAVAGMKYYNCDKSLVVTNSFFTYNAKNLAAVNECILIDRPKLTDWILAFQKGDH